MGVKETTPLYLRTLQTKIDFARLQYSKHSAEIGVLIKFIKEQAENDRTNLPGVYHLLSVAIKQ